jgi:WD40 repeat protein
VCLWDSQRSQCVLTIRDFGGSIRSLCFLNVQSPNLELIIGSNDNAIRYWSIYHQGDKLIDRLSWTSHQATLIAGNASLDNVRGLSHNNFELLKQHGAIGDFPCVSDPKH